jgi:hypothetical protein
MTKIVQTPNLIVMLDEGLTYRQIFTDGRPLETDPNPSWMGYSVGCWDGDTLVVDSFGYNDRSWLNHGGHPHTQALRITERSRRPDFGHLQIEMTLSDQAIYARPWTMSLGASLANDTEVLEEVCNDDNGSHRQHYSGKASDEKKTEAGDAPDTLAKHGGIYEEQDILGQGPHPRIIEITVAAGKLYAELKGREKMQSVAQSETYFIWVSSIGKLNSFPDPTASPRILTRCTCRVITDTGAEVRSTRFRPARPAARRPGAAVRVRRFRRRNAAGGRGTLRWLCPAVVQPPRHRAFRLPRRRANRVRVQAL